MIDLSSHFDVAAAGLLGNADRTIVATINPNPYSGVNNIMGYGGWSENKSFMIRISNVHGGSSGSGFGDGSYCLGIAGYANDEWTTTLKISPNVETTFAISLDGVGDGTNSIAYFFLKEPTTGNWQMETVVLSNGQYNTELGEGFMIGGYPSSDTSVRHAYNGTIGQVKIYNFAVTSVNDIGIAVEVSQLASTTDTGEYIKIDLGSETTVTSLNLKSVAEYKEPRINMTNNIQNGYEVSASSIHNSETNMVWQVFDSLLTGSPNAWDQVWASSMATYVNSGGNWISTGTQLATGTVNGEWVKLKLPDKRKLVGYKLTRQDYHVYESSPKKFRLCLLYTSPSPRDRG